MRSNNEVTTVLTIAGSDPSGGAGIQADLKTFSRLRVYGTAIVAAMTVQNTLGVSEVAEVFPEFVAHQIDAIAMDIPPAATKTGMLFTAGVIEAVARKVKQHRLEKVVVDPVMVSSSGAALMKADAITTYCALLLPEAFLLTPNLDEASSLSGIKISRAEDMEKAAARLQAMGPRYVLVKGGHLPGNEAADVLFDGRKFSWFRASRIPVGETHGTGCVLSASIAAYLALGQPVEDAVESGKKFVTNAIKNAIQVGKGTRACDPLSLGELCT